VRFSIAFLLLAGIAFSVEDLWQRVKAKYGSKEGLKENAEKPLMTDTPMTNIEGSIRFNARVSCPSRREGILITFLPISGNEYRLLIRQDLDLDGAYEKTYDSGISVSGVCNSGIISCNPPGSWKNCEYYYWLADQNGYVELQNTNNPNDVGACFCTNSSCGVNSLDKAIVDYIVGGIAQAIMNARHDIVVSYAGFDLKNFSAKLYVQDKTQCAYPNIGIYGEVNPTEVYESQMPPDGYSYLIQKGYDRDTDSPYYLIKQASQIRVNGKSIGYPSRFTCTVRRDVRIVTQTRYEDCQTFTYNGENWCIVTEDIKDRGGGHCGGRTCRDCPKFVQGPISATFDVKKSQKWAIYAYVSATAGDRGGYWKITITSDGNKEVKNFRKYNTCSPSEYFEILGIANSVLETHSVKISQEQNSWGKNHSYPARKGIIRILKSQAYQGDTIELSVSDGCSTRNTQGCVLKNEWICDRNGQNCIQTVREGVNLGISPQNFCYQTSSQIDSYEICADGNAITVTSSSGYNDKTFSGTDYWFYIKREYECPPDEIDIDLSRTESVISSVYENSGSISYTDFGQTHSVDLSNVPKDTCSVAVCTVKLQKKDTSVFSDRTNRAQTKAGTNQELYERRVCEKDTNGNWKCPIYSGEVKVEDCSCNIGLDSVGFSVSISVLGSVVEASKDIICSSSPP